MLSMSHINNIRDLRKKGSTIKEIAEITHKDPKTVRKYLNLEDFSPQIPVQPERPSKLDPFKPIIDQWLKEDKKKWRKHNHVNCYGYALDINLDDYKVFNMFISLEYQS